MHHSAKYALLAGALLLAACGGGGSKSASSSAPDVTGTYGNLQSDGGQMVFDDKGNVTMTTGDGTFKSTYTVAGTTITIAAPGGSDMKPLILTVDDKGCLHYPDTAGEACKQ